MVSRSSNFVFVLLFDKNCRTSQCLPIFSHFCIRENVCRLEIYLFIKIKSAENMAHYHYTSLIQGAFSKYRHYSRHQMNRVCTRKGSRQRYIHTHTLIEIRMWIHCVRMSLKYDNNRQSLMNATKKSMREENDFIIWMCVCIWGWRNETNLTFSHYFDRVTRSIGSSWRLMVDGRRLVYTQYTL